MSRKFLFLLILSSLFISTIAEAQMVIRTRPGRRFGPKPAERLYEKKLPKFEPALYLSIGYGFPNLDKSWLPEYYDLYSGNKSQSGPVTGSVEYQFNRRMSVGLMVTHGLVGASYYDYYSSATDPVFNAKLENWSFMLNLTRYIPVNGNISPYFRTAIGVNTWTQHYTDASGNKANVAPVELPDLAYQAGAGVRFKLSKNAGAFAEIGYGKYILQGGLSLKF